MSIKEQELLWKKKRLIQDKLCELMQMHMGGTQEDDNALSTISKAVGLIDICKSVPELAWILEMYKILPPKYQHLYLEKKKN